MAPCCGRCGKFYWNRWGHANKVFCGRRCAAIKTAVEAQRERIAKEHRDKTARITQAIEAFMKDKPRATEWKEWVAKRAGVTKNYLTHRLNLGSRSEPDGLKLTKSQQCFFDRLAAEKHRKRDLA